MNKMISFSPPDITDEEINLVCEVLKSGWITSGPRVKQFEDDLSTYSNSDNVVALNSATAAMELILKVFNIGAGDEVITTPYTYAATSNVLIHRGIKPVYVDIEKDGFNIDCSKIGDAITEKTRAIMPVDIGGLPCNYDEIKKTLRKKDRSDILIIVDSAHSFGAKYKGNIVGNQCDFHTFSFHAVKNLTTAEGGALFFNNRKNSEELYKKFKITSLQGQTKDAFSKMKAGAWEYDIITDGFKCNMTDISAALGIVQLKRYKDILKHRKAICERYEELLKEYKWAKMPKLKLEDGTETSYHLYTLRIDGFEEIQRNKLITLLAEDGIATNVHFKPLPMLTLYRNLGYKVEDYPNAYNQYKNEISLPVHTKLTLDDVEYIVDKLGKYVKSIKF